MQNAVSTTLSQDGSHPLSVRHEFWWGHIRIPLLLFIAAATVLATTSIDLIVAKTLYFDTGSGQWIGSEDFWINTVLRKGGRWLIRGCVAVALIVWIGSYLNESWRWLRRYSGFFVLAVVLSVGAVGLLKIITNVDCPWDLENFGGRFPFVHLFEDRPDDLRRAGCFPAAHASSGFALMVLFFYMREAVPRWRWLGLGVGLAVGVAFGIAQQSRGAHFLSHDVWSAFVVWAVQLSLYVYAFGARLRPITR